MTVVILDQIHPALLRGIGAVHMADAQIEMIDALGNRLSGPDPATMPVVTQNPRILPDSAVLGQSITLNLGAAEGWPAPVAEWDFTLDGASMRDQLDSDAMTIELSLPGTYALAVRWRNAAGLVTATEAMLAVSAPVTPSIDYDSQALAYFDADAPFTGTAEDVATVNMRGAGGYVLSKTGSGATIRLQPDGLVFGDGAYLQSQSLTNQPTTDGLFAVVDMTLTGYGSNIGQILDGTGGHIKIRNSSGTIQAVGADDRSVNLTLGNVAYGARMIFAGQIDDVADMLSGYDAAGNLLSTPHAGLTDPAPNRISFGRYLNGTIHRLAIVGRAEGQEFPVTMREVVEDFRLGA